MRKAFCLRAITSELFITNKGIGFTNSDYYEHIVIGIDAQTEKHDKQHFMTNIDFHEMGYLYIDRITYI